MTNLYDEASRLFIFDIHKKTDWDRTETQLDSQSINCCHLVWGGQGSSAEGHVTFGRAMRMADGQWTRDI